ncbi:hypothetical protein RJ639_004892 [Escallonia herrerae]|uniref:Transposase (putative) gypsy type domain-containing protein n=1 Tax=Escallonia herrerae TaxID=1293975 RepID=A0AA89AV66_9ASTE|nr:hypothetical protein RJ639_004892 [Escallonia herrerae]
MLIFLVCKNQLIKEPSLKLGLRRAGYKSDAPNFMRVFFKICFVKRVANCPGWYYINSGQRLLKGGPKLNKGYEVGTSNPQPSTSQRLPPSSSQPSHSLLAKNALGDGKDQADDKANPKPWYTAYEKSTNYDTKFETGIYEEQVKSGYRFPLHPFALCFFKHYHMAPRRLVPNGWRKLVGLIYLVRTSGYKLDAIDFMRVCNDIGMPNSQISEQHLVHRVLPREKEVFQNQTHETFACSFAQAVYTMYASGSEMLSCFEMVRHVAAEEAQ